MLRMTPVALALMMVWGAYPTTALAQDNKNNTAAEATKLKEVTVSATRTERRVDDVPSTVTVTTQEDIEENGATDIKSMFKEELGVSVRKGPQRFGAASGVIGRGGNESINIRGIEGNRVLMTLDGIRLPDAHEFGPTNFGRGEYIDVDTLKSAEILRGAASTQFGSDGLAGAVSFRTLDPADLLKKGQNLGGFVRGGYAGADSSYGLTGGVATRGESFDAMVLLSYRKGHETENMGDNNSRNSLRTNANPADYNNKSAIMKANFAINSANKVGVAVDYFRRQLDTDVLSGLGPQFMGNIPLGTFTNIQGKDKTERTSVTLSHQYLDPNGSFIQRAESKVFWQETKAKQYTYEARSSGNRERNNTMDTKAYGLSTLLESNFTNQRLTYGVDWYRAQIDSLRDGFNFTGARFAPSQAFPKTTNNLIGAFVQDEIDLGIVNIIPALRYDSFKLTPEGRSAIYNNPTTSLSGNKLSPRLGVVLRIDPLFTPYIQWAEGFKAPTPEQVNSSFSNSGSGYVVEGNPNLKPEKSTTYEIGIRGKNSTFNYAVAAFQSDYKDFIETTTTKIGNIDHHKAENRNKAKINGVEARAGVKITSNLSMNAGLAYTRGTSETNTASVPLNSIDPMKASLGLRYERDAWGVHGDVTYLAAKERDRIDGAALFATPSSTIVDLGAYWKPVKNVRVIAGINNVFNQKYWNWSDVRGSETSSKVLDAFTAPGRNAHISVRYDF